MELVADLTLHNTILEAAAKGGFQARTSPRREPRDHLLSGEILDTLQGAQVIPERWRRHDNHV